MIRSIPWLVGLAGALVSVMAIANVRPAAADLQALRAQAHKGVPAAEFHLGELYQWGVGRKDHLEKALVWYERAAAHVPLARTYARRVAAQLTPAQRAWVHHQVYRPHRARRAKSPMGTDTHVH